MAGKPQIKVDLTVDDKSDAGFRKAEARAKKYADHAKKVSGQSGLTRFGEFVRGLSKLSKLEFSGEGLSRLGSMSKSANENIGGLTRGVLSLGSSAPGVLGTVAEGAGLVAGAAAAATAAVVGLGAATYALGDKWAKTGGEIGRTSKTLDVATDWLQATRAANERFGVSADQTTASVDAFASTMYDAKYGANNLALGALTQLGVKLKTTKDGNLDVAASFDEVSEAIARQKDPAVQRKLATIFGMQAMLPAIREGGAKLNAARADFLSSGAALSPEQVAASKDTEEKTVRLRQHLGALEKKAGMAALGATALAADKGVGALHAVEDAPGKLWESAKSIARDLPRAGAEAGQKLVAGAQTAAHDIANAVRGASGNVAARATAFFQTMGFTPQQARGMTAGAYAESGLNPSAVNPKSGAFGIGQWLGGRKAELFKQYGPHPTFENQLSFMGWELQNTEHAAAGAIKSAPTADAALEAYVQRFMRPAKGAETSGDIARGDRFLGVQASPETPKAHLTVDFRNLPPNAAVRADSDPGVHIDLGVHRALQGAP